MHSASSVHPLLAMLVSTGLLASGLIVAEAEVPREQTSVEADPFDLERVSDARDVRELAPLESPGGRPVSRELEAAGDLGDFSNPPLQGSALATAELQRATDIAAGRVAKDDSFDPATSNGVDSETTRQAEVFENRDGTRTAVLSAGPERFQNDAGVWIDYDLRFQPADDGSFAAAASDLDVVVPADPARDGIAVATHAKGDRVRFGLPSALEGAGSPVQAEDVLSGNGHVATDDARGVSAAVTLTTGGFEQQVTFASRDLIDDGGYSLVVELPAGWSVRQGDKGTNRVEFLDASGALAATFGSGVAWDSTGGSIADARLADAMIRLASTDDDRAVIDVSVDERWLDAATFPVTIDPTYSYTFTTSSTWADTFAQSGLSTPMENGVYLSAGKSATIGWAGIFLKFPLPGAVAGAPTPPDPLTGIVSAELKLRVYSYNACSAQKWKVNVNTEAWTPATMTYSSGMPDAELFPTAETVMQNPGCTDAWYSFFPRSGTQRQFDGTAAPHGFRVSASSDTATDSIRVARAAEYGSNAAQLIVTYEWRPDTPDPVAPADEATVTTTRPKLEVTPETDGDGNAVKYWFRVYTDPEYDLVASGQVINSGWIDDPHWTPPAEYLTDGGTYYWTATSTDWNTTTGAPRTIQRPPSMPQSFTIDTQLGNLSDGMGPIGVDLTTGNGSMALGGPGGVSLTYNTSDAPATGLTGSYYQDTNGDFAFNDSLVVSRRDSTVGFEWFWGRSPDPTLNADDFLVRWEGTITPPQSGSWEFGSPVDDRVRIWVNGTQVLNKWTTADLSTTTAWGAPISLTGGTQYDIKIEYAEDYEIGNVHLQAKLPSSPYSGGLDVPTSWLLPKERVPEMAPPGWWASVDAGGSPYTSVVALNDTAVMMSGDAAVLTFERTLTGFEPPEGTEATLSVDTTGRYVLLEDGTRYVFNTNGTLEQVMASTDDGAQVPDYAYTTISNGGKTYPRVASITEPDTSRTVTYTWSGAGSCPTASGFSTPPVGMICKALDWDGAVTSVLYDSSGRIARFIADPDPGTANDESITDFGYDTCSRISTIRDPLAAATVAAGFRANNDTTRWLVGYTPTSCSSGDWIWDDDINSVTAPEPTASQSRPKTTWNLTTPGQTDTLVAGLTAALGYTRRVTYNSEGQLLSDTDATGLTTTYLYDSQGRNVSTVDPAGLKTTSIYNAQDLLTDEWGPAPSTYWTSATDLGTPLAGQQSATPHTTHTYDENTNGLGASWYNTATLSPDTAPGASDPDREVTLATGVGASGGVLDKTWTASAKPPGVVSITDASASLTGRIAFGPAGTYQLKLTRQQKVNVWLDDEQIITTTTHSDADTPIASFTTTQANESHRLRIETIADPADTEIQLKLWWDLPGGSTSWVVVPGANLTPDYGLETSTTDPDGRATAYGYADATRNIGPHHGARVTTTRDPGASPNLNLVDTNIYSDPTTGDLTQTGRTLPTGAASLVTYSNYGDTETADNPCTVGTTEAINQRGAPKERTDADPDGVGSATGIAHISVYNDDGQAIASGTNNTDWICTAYDIQGRPSEVVYPAYGGASSRTVTYSYAVGGNPLVSSVSDAAGTITTMVDLLGRTVFYEDVWGTDTTITYDQAGRESGNTSPAGTFAKSYDDVGRLDTLKLGGYLLADVGYDSVGRPVKVDYKSGGTNVGNGTWGDFAYDVLGRPKYVKWSQAGGTTLTYDEVTSRSLAGRVLDNKIDGTDPSTSNPSFVYDDAGRLTTARTPGSHTFTYAFAASGGCGVATTAGVNTNRTSKTVDGGTPTTYCYDHADRLTSSSDTAVGTIIYDFHGSSTGIFGETHAYDAANRHRSTLAGSTTVGYTRDALDRIVNRSISGVTAARYSYTASSDNPSLTLNSSGTVIEALIALPGGAILTTRAGGNVWSYPNLHGDVVAAATQAGVKTGSTVNYDPDGNLLNSATHPDNAAGTYDYGWLGAHQRPREANTALEPIVEMGDRQYSSYLGRFLEVDAADGGVENSYDYPGDPVNTKDLNGRGSLYAKCWNGNNVCFRAGAWSGQIYIGRIITEALYRSRNSTTERVLWARVCLNEDVNNRFDGSITTCINSLLGVSGDFKGALEKAHSDLQCLSMKFSLYHLVQNLSTMLNIGVFTFNASAVNVLNHSTWVAGNGLCRQGRFP